MFMKAKLMVFGCLAYILLGAGAVYAHSDLSSVGCHAQGRVGALPRGIIAGAK